LKANRGNTWTTGELEQEIRQNGRTTGKGFTSMFAEGKEKLQYGKV